MLNKKPMLLVLAGPNGSGKSTVTQFFEKAGEYTNADDVVAATGMDNKSAAELVEKNVTKLYVKERISHLRQCYLHTINWTY